MDYFPDATLESSRMKPHRNQVLGMLLLALAALAYLMIRYWKHLR